MLNTLNDLLQCLGPCGSIQLSPSVLWEYSVGPSFPLESQLLADRLHIQGQMLGSRSTSIATLSRYRFTVFGGLGSVGQLVAEDLQKRIRSCLGCYVREIGLETAEVSFPQKNSDRKIPITVLQFSLRF